MRGLIAGLALVFACVCPVAASTDAPVLRLYTNNGTFRVRGPVSASETNMHGGTAADGAVNPKTPPLHLRFGEHVRFSLPAFGGRVTQYIAARLQYGSVTAGLNLAHPVWRPAKLGNYVVNLNVSATWTSADDRGTTRSTWVFKVRVSR